jgi:hypothetical protein
MSDRPSFRPVATMIGSSSVLLLVGISYAEGLKHVGRLTSDTEAVSVFVGALSSLQITTGVLQTMAIVVWLTIWWRAPDLAVRKAREINALWRNTLGFGAEVTKGELGLMIAACLVALIGFVFGLYAFLMLPIIVIFLLREVPDGAPRD